METIQKILPNPGPFPRLMGYGSGSEISYDLICFMIERTRVMVLQFDEELRIENPRNYPTEIVGELRSLLSSGRPVQQDPRRKDIYEIQGSGSTLYVYVSPLTQTVVLLARWSRQTDPFCVEMAEEIA
jgi:hypothetical protein